MSVTFRFATPDEIPAVARLVTHSFPGAGRTAAWWEEQLRHTPYGGGADVLWVGEEGGRLVAACQLHRMEEWVGGATLPVMGLGTVTIAPTHRKRGLAAEMVTAGLRAARQRGDLASALYPFRISFYGKLGYGLAGEAIQYRVAPECLPDHPSRTRVELVDAPERRAEVERLYGRWGPTQTGQVVRPPRVWDTLLGAPDRALFAFRAESGEVEGYALVVYRTDLPPQERYLEVEELVWSTPAARRGLYAWLASLGDQWRQLLLRALPSQRLGDWVQEPRLPWGSAPPWGLWFASATLLRGPMFRLVELAGAWERRSVAPGGAMTVALDVQDDQLPDNAGEWRLRLEEGRVAVERGGGGGAADLALRLRVDTLSRILVGSLPPSAAAEAGLLQADRAASLPELDRLLRLPEPWTFDRF